MIERVVFYVENSNNTIKNKCSSACRTTHSEGFQSQQELLSYLPKQDDKQVGNQNYRIRQ